MNYHCPRPPKQRAFDTSLLMWRRRFLSGTAFSPASLFASGEDGGWYDPSDLTSMYVGINGSGGNPSVGDQVGVVLDKSQMGGQTAAAFIEGQSEIVTDISDYSFGAGWTVVDGTLVGSPGSQNLIYSVPPGTFVDGRYYKIEVVVSAHTSGSVEVRIYGTDTYAVTGAISTVGTYTFLIRGGSAGAVSGSDQFLIRLLSPYTGTISSFSIKEIPGNHLVAPALIQRPLLQTEGGRYYLDFDGVDDEFSTSGYTAQANPTSLFTAYSTTTDTQYIVFSSGATSTYYILAVQQSSSDTLIQSNAGTPSYRFNGTAFTGTTRGDVYTAVSGGAKVVVAAESVNLTPVLWTDIGVFNFSGGGVWQFSGRWYGAAFIDRALTTAERDSLELFLANKSGATIAT